MFPCVVCQKQCDGENVVCDVCDQSFHQRCKGLSSSNLIYFRNCLLFYVCLHCCISGGVYDFDRALYRLENACKSEDLEIGIKMESVFMQSLSKRLKTGRPQALSGNMVRDNVATKLIGHADYVPVAVRGNGNCLFNSISVAIQGNDNLASEIKVRTCIEMFENKDFYINLHKLVCNPYDQALKSVNGLLDPSVGILNCYFQPRGIKSKHTINIIWSSMSNDQGNWVANHFLSLLVPTSGMDIIDLSSETEFPPPSPNSSKPNFESESCNLS